MQNATLIYPHQLAMQAPAITAAKANGWPVYLVEEPLFLTHNPIHRQKLMLHKLSMDAFARELKNDDITVHRLDIHEHQTTEQIFVRLQTDGITHIHVADTTDDYLEQAITESELTRVWYESPLFYLEREDALTRYQNSGKQMAQFYQTIRKDYNILVDESGSPTGGQWSFDIDNRESLPTDLTLPDDVRLYGNSETAAAADWCKTVDAEQYGEMGSWLPYTHDGARAWLKDFLAERFVNFGPYEDAIATEHVRVFHAALSPLLNIGLLTPSEVVDEALTYANEHNVPLNSLEGFVRQIIGWREFMRASYEADGRTMRSQNFWQHKNDLPPGFWDATTDLAPLDLSIKRALDYGYTHHIERLMVLGNFLLLAQTHPDQVYRWFMALYIDAYDWVMVPNVYGMSQFADGGTFATKPYISGSNYLNKMADYAHGSWEDTWTALYWHFIDTHLSYFKQNQRLSMMTSMLEKMNEETRTKHQNHASAYLQTMTTYRPNT